MSGESRCKTVTPIPPPMAASGRFLGLDPAHGQNWLENVKKL